MHQIVFQKKYRDPSEKSVVDVFRYTLPLERVRNTVGSSSRRTTKGGVLRLIDPETHLCAPQNDYVYPTFVWGQI